MGIVTDSVATTGLLLSAKSIESATLTTPSPIAFAVANAFRDADAVPAAGIALHLLTKRGYLDLASCTFKSLQAFTLAITTGPIIEARRRQAEEVLQTLGAGPEGLTGTVSVSAKAMSIARRRVQITILIYLAACTKVTLIARTLGCSTSSSSIARFSFGSTEKVYFTMEPAPAFFAATGTLGANSMALTGLITRARFHTILDQAKEVIFADFPVETLTAAAHTLNAIPTS